MNSQEIRQKFLTFFKERNHVIVPSSSLIPDDPSVLLTTAGMQQFKRYFTGELDPMKDFGSKNTVSIQKSFRTSDIDEVGDESHLTFFEMLGNFSFGGYFKEEAIKYGYEFITKELGLKIDYVSVFKGDSRMKLGQKILPDIESEKIWRSLGIKDIRKFGREDNFWGPTGIEGPCGSTTEIYVNGVEIWNIVFNEYYGVEQSKNWLIRNWNRMMEGKGHRNLKLTKLETPGIDTGMGLERLAMVSQNVPTIFDTDLFSPFMSMIPTKNLRIKRIIADHIRGAVHLIADGVEPSNKDRGYILRRLIRRVIAHEFLIGFGKEGKKVYVGAGKSSGVDFKKIFFNVADYYAKFYPSINRDIVWGVFGEENERFRDAFNRGLKEMYNYQKIDGKVAFRLYESFGLSYEIIKDLSGERVKNLRREDFDKEFKKHQEISRAGQEKKFGGHGLILNTVELKAGNEEELNKVLRLHTATHLLQQALREVLGPEVGQMGSDITPERTRFDFTFDRKMTQEEIEKVENVVNKKIKEDLPVQYVELPKAEAEKVGALYFFKEKYPDKVKVYFVGKDLKSAWSKEFCGGPHVTRTGMIGRFKIAKEETVGAGVRRIRGTVE